MLRTSMRVDWPLLGLYIGTRTIAERLLWPQQMYDAIGIAERSELLAETLGEHVFDFFLRNKRAEWDDYRGQVSPFERERMLPVI